MFISQHTMKSHRRKVLASAQVTRNEGCGTGEKMGADGGTKPKEMPVKEIPAVKIQAKKKNILSAIPKVRPVNIGMPQRKKTINLNISEVSRTENYTPIGRKLQKPKENHGLHRVIPMMPDSNS